MAVSMALAFGLPTKYQSEATLLIERQSIPPDLVESTVNTFVQEIIQQITQKLLTYESLLGIATTHNLYPEKQIKSDPRRVVEEMRDSFEVKMLDVRATDPNKSGSREATIAFTVAFTANTPEQARDVTAEITDRYLKEHEIQRQLQAEKVREFIEAEALKLRAQIEEMESELAEFKQEEIHTLPELKDVNLRLYEKTEGQIETSQERVRELEDRLEGLRASLSVTPAFENVRTDEGSTLLNATDRLNSLVAQYLRATSRYSAKHPDVIRLNREIRTLTEQTGTSGRADELMDELVRLQEELRQAQQRYGDGHPDVARLEKSVSALQQGFESALIGGNDQGKSAQPDNPAYVSLQTQIRGAQSSLEAERSKLRRLEGKLTEYERRIFETPQVEVRYQNLLRDYNNAVSQYNELSRKQLDSDLALTLEAGEGGEQFLLSSPAFLPKMPDSPNRIGILLIGVLLAGVFGALAAAIAEYADRAIYDVRDITAVLGAPPLAVIPKISLGKSASHGSHT